MGARPLAIEEAGTLVRARVAALQDEGADYPTAVAVTACEAGLEIQTILDLIVRFAPAEAYAARKAQGPTASTG